MSDDFHAPPWVCEPKLQNCGLKIRKDGKIISIVTDLNKKKYLTLGRNAKMSDIRLEHPSISRRHAMFGHGSSGNIYVMDLGSSHGTFVNDKKLKSKQREALHDGDVVRFGASTREYIVKLDLDSPDEKKEINAPPNKKQKLNDESSKETLNNYDENGHEHEHEHEHEHHQSLSAQSSNHNNNNNINEVTCRHLLIKHKDSRRPKSWKNDNITRTKEEALNICQNLRNDIIKNNNNNENIIDKFSEIAKQESDCNSAKRGGDLGKFGRGKMQQPFEEAAFALNIGELSQPVDTDSGIHLILRTA
jgi:NIMA-interacting peptidyl-prolyl cis-trans isomerase 1